MKKYFKRVISAALSAAMVITSLTVVNVSTASAAGLDATAQGWFESVYAEWKPVAGTAYYIAEIKGAGESDDEYETVDDELIRQYDAYNRVDVVGLAAGSYDLKITAYDTDNQEIASTVLNNITATAYDRSGAAFSSKNLVSSASAKFATEGVGAYKNDGTLKDGAKVLYVTKDTAKTVSTDVITGKKGTTTRITGIQAILDAYQKGLDTTPLDIRIVGTVKKDDLDKISSSKEGLQIKGNKEYSELNITLEGIGNDAVVYGFGFLLRNTASVELRNFAILNFMDDGVSLDTANSNDWIHNLDIFYGGQGGDSDQAKGDGSVDVKAKSTNITVSYNHFWDSGKSSLCGMGEETADSHITYHHNWFDHSDSRHPRVRAMSVHIYNNYYDGNAKYGSASAKDASLFVQNNYYRSCKYPVIIGGQGHEISSDGKGTLSGETGSPAKLSGNIMTGSYQYTDYADSHTNFDGVKVDNASQKLDSSIKAVDGSSYNNFDTDTSKYDLAVKKLDEAKDVPTIVMASAGRCQGGDIFYDISKEQSNADANYSVDSKLKNVVTGYQPTVKVIGGTVIAGATNPNNPDSKPSTDPDSGYGDRDDNNQQEGENQGNIGDQGSTGDSSGGETIDPDDGNEGENPPDSSDDVPPDPVEPDTPPVTGTLIYNHTSGENTLHASVGGSDKKEAASFSDGKSFEKAIKFDSKGSLTFTTNAKGTMKIYTTAKKDGAKLDVDGTVYTLTKASAITTIPLEAGSHTIKKNDSESYLYYVEVTLEGGSSSETTTVEPGGETTTAAPIPEGEKVELGEPVTEDSVKEGTTETPGDITYTPNSNGDGGYTITDTHQLNTGNVTYPIPEQTEGIVTISGTVRQPGGNSGGWTLIQVQGKKPGTEAGTTTTGEVFGIRTLSSSDATASGGTEKAFALRVNGQIAGSTATTIAKDTDYDYSFVIDFKAQTVKLTVGGSSTNAISFADAGIQSVSGIKFVTAGGARNIAFSKPEVTVAKEGESDTSTEATTTSAQTTTAKDTPSETTTADQGGDTPADGNVDGVNGLTANDAAIILAYVKSDGTLKAQEGWNFDRGDVDGDKTLTAKDAAEVLKKVLDPAHKFNSSN